jgi:uncharacterized Zn finger protein (UPF0148 family)
MFCPRCGMPVAQGAQFCSRCGQPFVAAPTPAPAAQQMQREASGPHQRIAPGPYQQTHIQSQKRSKSWLWIPIVGALIVGTVFLTLFMAGAFQQEAEAPQTAALKTQATAPPPVLEKGAEVPKGMPPEVRDWLEHLRRIEIRKNELHAQTAAEMRVFMAALPGEVLRPFLEEANGIQDPVDPSDDVNPRTITEQRMKDLSPDWEQLVADYRSYPPPAECQALADDYDRALGEIPAAVRDISKIVNQVQDYSQESATAALEQLYKMQGGSGAQIDQYFRQADDKLGGICNQYNVNKWFAISPDMPGGTFSSPGF